MNAKSDGGNHANAVTVAGMGACYALGTFTDNFYKQAAILLAAASQMGSIQSIATVLFSLPFVLCSAWAGWLADKLPKKHIVVAAKTMEFAALAVGGIMLVWGNWVGILAVIFIMGLQATIFSPAINGSIPENFPDHQVPRVNSLIKLASTAAILAGMAMAGFFLDLRPQELGGALPDALLPQKLLESLGGSAMDGPAYGRAYAALFVLLVALLGLGTAFLLRKKPAGARETSPPFPWTGPLDSLRYTLACRSDRQLFTVLMAEAFFYGVAAIAVISIANLATSLGYSNTRAGILTAVLMTGIAAGSLIAGKKRAENWRRMVIPSALGMSCMLFLTSATPLFPETFLGFPFRFCWLFATLFSCGLFGGLYLIPLSSFIQVRPTFQEKGKIVAVSNFAGFLAMAIFGVAFQGISLLPPALTFAVYGVAFLIFSLAFLRRRIQGLEETSMRDAAASPLGILLRALLSLRYRVTEQGLDDIPAMRPETRQRLKEERAAPESGAVPPIHAASTGILFLPNHPALIDPLLVYSRLAGLRPRPLADQRQLSGFLQSLAGRIVRAVPIPDLEKDGRRGVQGVREGLETIIGALQKGDNVLLYPAGRIYRTGRESLGGNSAVAKIIETLPDVRIVLVRTTGLWGSSFSYATGKKPDFMRSLLRGAAALVANAFMFMPKREVRMEFVEKSARELLELRMPSGGSGDEKATGAPQLPPAGVSEQGRKAAENKWLEAFYNESLQPARAFPLFFWQGTQPRELPEPKAAATARIVSVPEETKERVYALLRSQAELDDGHTLSPGLSLREDLHMDSLALMELGTALETEFGHPLPSLENLNTVEDCLAAATGELAGGDSGLDDTAGKKASLARWFAPDDKAGEVLAVAHPAGVSSPSVPSAFLLLTKQAPGKVLTADRSGVRTRRQILTGVLALARRFSDLPGKRLGIMLPATPAALVAWLAAMLAGKEPVMLNWTLGERNMRHCLEISGLRHAVTASALLEQLEHSGNPVRDTPIDFIRLDSLVSKLSLFEKIHAFFLASLHCSPLPFFLSTARVPETAAILFTSGSESIPKAVPLTHRNIMTNASDVAQALKVRRSDRLLAMLPPFHSFGLLAGLTLPAASGLAAAYHPNPTESSPLIFMVRDFKLALLGATPTFLEGMLRKADSNDLSSLRYAFVGAEKCPDHVYRLFAEKCPGASLCEGYGITECSPVVSVNRPESVLPGSIGHALPSVTAEVVVEDADSAPETYSARKAGEGETGMLLVRGPSIFSGYLSGAAAPAPNPFVSFAGEYWYRTGDLVSRDGSGRLYFQGRLKRFVKIAGEMLSLPLMESILQEELENSRGSEAPAEEGKPLVAVESRSGSEEAGSPEILAFSVLPLTTQEANGILRRAGLAPVYAIKRVVRVGEIPLLGTGKTDYRALQTLL